jgi:hypothetical protein
MHKMKNLSNFSIFSVYYSPHYSNIIKKTASFVVNTALYSVRAHLR